MRKRFKRSMLCSSDRYRESRRAYLFFLKELHNNNKVLVNELCNRVDISKLSIEDNLRLGKKGYIRCLGKEYLLSASELLSIGSSYPIIWR